MSNRNDFVIENGVLKAYSGQCGDIVIPDEVVKIERCAFASNGWIRDVTFPSHQVEMDYGAFYGCSNLKHMTIPVCSLAGTIFGEAGNSYGEWSKNCTKGICTVNFCRISLSI